MPSNILNTIISRDNFFSVNFPVINYDKDINSSPILNIWTDIKISLKQEEKVNGYLYFFHEIKVGDTLESISNLFYETEAYWWLILVANDIIDPFDFKGDALNNDIAIRVIKPQFLSKILSENNSNDISKYLGMNNA